MKEFISESLLEDFVPLFPDFSTAKRRLDRNV
jgi:hypothetical protein